ncbi:uncharacterized protein LOC134229862 [Saccostrea cucullata]|uniref:uncharacterized protein LOC134229862 n=1 Tax=Saccostrea cuccullata TaxID=36930 RepID=UPI002ED01EF2
MQIFGLLFSVLMLFLISELQADIGDDAQKATDVVKAGIEATVAITDIIEGVQVLTKFSTMLGKVNPYLAAIGPVMDIITIFLPKQEDPTLTFLKTKFSEVDSKFRNMERLFDQVTNLIKSKALKTQFSGIEQSVKVLSYRLNMLMKAPKDAVNGQKSRFIKDFEVSYQSAAKKIYNGIMTKQHFTDNIPDEAMAYSNYDRRKMQSVMAGCVGLLMTAVKVNLAYLELTNNRANYEMEKREWEKNIKDVLQKVKDVDQQVTHAWGDQKFKDLKQLSAQYRHENHEQFAKRLFNFYSKKYYWRDWVVIVYNEMAENTGTNGHAFDLCGGDKYLQKDGRNVLTSSVPKERSKMYTYYYQRQLSHIRTETVVWGVHYPWKAISVLNQIRRVSHSNVCMKAVISDRQNIHAKGSHGRLVGKWKYFYNMYIFG